MTTLTQKIEDLKKSQNSLIEKLRNDRSDKKIMEQYKNLDAQIKELKKEENLQTLKKKIDDFNEANDEVKKVIPLIMEYKDTILKVGGGHTKKFDNFLKSIESNFSIYAVKRSTFSEEIEIILQHKNKVNFKIYFENGEYKIYDSKNIDFETVIEARLSSLTVSRNSSGSISRFILNRLRYMFSRALAMVSSENETSLSTASSVGYSSSPRTISGLLQKNRQSWQQVFSALCLLFCCFLNHLVSVLFSPL